MTPMPVPLLDHAGLDARTRAALEQALGSLTTLERVLEWTREAHAAGVVEEIVTQDEYTHDVLVPFRGGRYLVFDTS